MKPRLKKAPWQEVLYNFATYFTTREESDGETSAEDEVGNAQCANLTSTALHYDLDECQSIDAQRGTVSKRQGKGLI